MAGEASRENGKKGGRPRGTKTAVTIAREKAREYLSRRVEEEIEPIADSLIAKAQDGDVPAIKELFDRAWGKSKEAMDITSGGERIVFMPSEILTKHNIHEGTSQNTEGSSN